MILKNIIGAGARGLIDYLSQASKSTTTEHINDYRIPLLHVPDVAINAGARLGKPATGFRNLQTLSGFNVVGERQRGEVLLQPDAPHHLEPGRAGSTVEVRRPGDRPGRVGREEATRSVAPFVTNMAGRTPRELASEIATLRRQRPGLKKAVSHLVLSHDPNQRKLTVEEWKEAVQIALKEHGAEEAAHAAWRHADTDHDHVHIFFCRILPSGDVVSDSHNYRKNEAAARLIERTFMLEAPTPTAAEDRPGDRQALDSASRRADRRGTPPPSKIDVRAIRAALAEARNRDHFLQLLAELGIEAEFDRRGVAREIYGWRLRRIGAAEWLKASTAAKDLSWPKIAHRFAESESVAPVAQTPLVEGAPGAPVQTKADADQYARAPAPLRQMLREQHQQRQLVPTPKLEPAQPTKKGWDIDLAEVGRATQDFGVLTRSMALLGAACIKYSLSFLKSLIGWLKKLLAKLGFGVRETQLVSGPQAVAYEPYTIDAEAREVPDAEAAAQLVTQVASALENRDASLLPDVEGRDVIAAAMLTDSVDEHDPLARLLKAGTDYLRAEQAVGLANTNPPADLILVQEARKARGVFSEQLGCSQLSFKRELSHIDDPVFKVQLEAKLKKAIDKFAKLPIEGGAEALQECVDLVTEVRRLAVEDQIPFPEATAAAMMTDPGRQPEENALDEMFSTESADAAATAPVVPEAPPATPPKKPLAMFLDAAKAFTVADAAVKQAQLKDIMYFDGRPLAQTRHDDAAAEVFELEKAVTGWRAAHKVAAALGADPLGLKPQLEAARARAANTQAALQKADREHAEFRVLFAKTPVPTVPFALQDRHTAAAVELKRAQELLISRAARLNLTILDGNPMLRSKREQFGSQIRRAETRLAAFLADPRTQPTAVKDVEDMIRSLSTEVAIERAPRPDADEGQNSDEAGHAVPGQR